MTDTMLVTGGAGFIGSAVVRRLISSTQWSVVNVDKLTYAGNLESLEDAARSQRYSLEVVDICDHDGIERIFQKYKPIAVMNLAAESHVDRSIDGPGEFINTNIVGTYNLLERARAYWSSLPDPAKDRFRFHHVSTDEVYGSLGKTGRFTESTRYKPNSPYSASKASSDHLVRAWGKTYGLPVVLTNCSNNYGPYQFPEKLIPLMIQKAMNGSALPIYGKGDNIRDWLYVDDHAEALITVVEKGAVGQVYNIGGHNEKTNLEVVETLCAILDRLAPNPRGSYRDQIEYVADRPGHDKRYAIDASKIKADLGWTPRETFDTGIEKTVAWYLDNIAWCERAMQNYQGQRLGVGGAR